MRVGLAALVAGYGLSQFYRAFLAVLTPVLEADIGASPGDLAVASGLWFSAFAAVQLPIGWSLDAIGPRRTAGALLGICGAGGAAIFALATRPLHLDIAMTLLGMGCAPVLMCAYYLLARCWPPAAFGAMAGVTVGVGSLGDMLGTAPLVRAIEAFGWRPTMWGLVAVTLAVSALIWTLVRDPAPEAGHEAAPRASMGALLRIRGLWPMLPLIFASYASSVAIRGVWAAPLLQTVHGGDARLIGRGTLTMGLAMVAGNLLTGPIVQLMGSARTAALWGSAAAAVALAVLWLWPDAGLVVTFAALAVLGLSGANYALLMTHGRAFLPPHLVGRGITFLNMISLAGVGVLQFASRPIYEAVLAQRGPSAAIAAVFLFFLVPLVVGIGIYCTSAEAADGPVRA